jgi:hypothetical protein
MKLNELADLYSLISRGTENVSSRKLSMKLRKAGLASTATDNGFTKVAFDTRRIDQETEYNPRRGLQNYNRSAAFVSEALSQKLINFSKLRKVLVGLKEIYGKEPEWQDSNARVLLSTIDKGLRTESHDGDYTESQPGVGSFDYIEELMHVRYRLGFDDLTKMGEVDLKRVILGKDEELTRKDVNKTSEITKSDVATQSYDTLLEKLFGVQASSEHPDIERTVTITIRDTIRK